MILTATVKERKEWNWDWVYSICNYFFKARDSKVSETCTNFIKLKSDITIVCCILVNTCIYACNISQ